MLTKRIIPCLDIKDGRVVKGTNFVNLKDAGDPIELAKLYNDSKADEIVFLDITATSNKSELLIPLVRKIGKALDIPFTIGGGVKSLMDAKNLLDAGADKVAVNSAAVKNPELIRALSQTFGAQCIVAAVDYKLLENGIYKVFVNGGKKETALELFSWVKELQELGAGELLLTSMDHDGTRNGFDLDVLNRISSKLKIPIIASGGAGNASHFVKLFKETTVDAALAAGIFHFGQVDLKVLKLKLKDNKINIR